MDGATYTEVLPFSRLFAEVTALYRSGGLPRGDSTGWPSVDEYFTVSPGQWTVITGMPSSGKSEWLDAMMMNLAASEEWEFAIYSPENHPVSTHVVKLIEKRLNKPFNPGPTERATEQEIKDAQMWIYERFFWLAPESAAPEYLIELAAERRGAKKLGVVLDPWNTLDHERNGMSETDYVSYILTKVTKLARATPCHVFLVAHPAKLYRDRDGNRPVPTPYDIAGSAHWYNKADNCITVHRPTVDGQEVDVHIQKVRFKHIGKRGGPVTLLYDRVTGVYFEMLGVPGERYRSP